MSIASPSTDNGRGSHRTSESGVLPEVTSRLGRSCRATFAVAALLIGLLTVGLYGASLSQPFTSDDYQYLHGCRQLAGHSLISVFHPAVQGIVLPPFYRPTSVAFFLLLYRLAGAEPVLFHACLFLVRLTTLLLALWCFSRLLGHPGWGGVATAALAVSPFGIEPGVWPAAVPDSFLGLFLFGAVVSFDELGRWEARREKLASPRRTSAAVGWGWSTAVVASGLLALASKEPAVIVPLLLACLPGRSRKLGRAAIAVLLVGVGLYVALRFWMHAHMPPPPGYDYWNVFSNPKGLWWWQSLLSGCGYLVSGPVVLPWVPYLGAAILVAAVVLVARSHRGLPRYGLVFALLLLLPLALTAGVSRPRYGFIPAMGAALILTAFARLGWRGRWRWPTAALLAGWIAFQASLSQFWIQEWARCGRASEEVARFVASRPREEETVLLWIPFYAANLYVGKVHVLSAAVTDAIYPAWMKELADKGDAALPLAIADGLIDSRPETGIAGNDLVEIQSGRHRLSPAAPSVYTGGRAPDLRTCAELVQQEGMRLQFRLKRAPHRAFFTLTPEGWREL